MTGWFGLDFAGIVGSKLDPACTDAMLHVVSEGVASPAALAYGSDDTEEDVPCRGYLANYDDHLIDGTNVLAGDRLVVLMASSLHSVTPAIDDRVTIENATYEIIKVDRDPGSATYELQARR